MQSSRWRRCAGFVSLVLGVCSQTFGVSRADSLHELSFKEKRGLAFDVQGGMILLDVTSLLYVTRAMDYHVIALPETQEEPQLLALDRGVWLRAGRTIAYASLERPWSSSDSNPVVLPWQMRSLDDLAASHAAKAASDGNGNLLLEVTRGKVLELTPSEHGLVRVQGPALLPPEPEIGRAFAFDLTGEQVVMKYNDAEGATHSMKLPVMRDDKLALARARLVNDRGRVWFASDDYIFSEQGTLTLVISRELPRVLAAQLRRQLPDSESVVAAFPVFAACLCLGLCVWWLGERPRYRPLARALGASVVAPPFVYLSALTIDTIGIHASPAALFGPIAAAFTLLPPLGAGLGDLLSRGRDTAPHAARSFSRAFLGTLAGGLLGVPLMLYMLSRHSDSDTALVATICSSLIVGCGTAFGYLRVPSVAQPHASAS